MGTEFLFIIPPIIIFGGDILDAIHGAMARRAVHYIRMVVVPRWYLFDSRGACILKGISCDGPSSL